MNNQEKLELLVQCDFSWWRQRERGIKNGDECFGFGNAVFGMIGSIYNVVKGVRPLESLDVAKKSYSFLLDCYNKIPFNQMGEGDADFEFLFEYKKTLKEFGSNLCALESKFKRSEKITRDSREFKMLIPQIELLKEKNYRRAVLRKYGIDLPN